MHSDDLAYVELLTRVACGRQNTAELNAPTEAAAAAVIASDVTDCRTRTLPILSSIFDFSSFKFFQNVCF